MVIIPGSRSRILCVGLGVSAQSGVVPGESYKQRMSRMDKQNPSDFVPEVNSAYVVYGHTYVPSIRIAILAFVVRRE